MIIIQALLTIVSIGSLMLLIALIGGIRLIWPILACLTLAILWTRGPKIAESLGNGLAPRFISVYDTYEYDHTTGKWKPDSNGVWRKVRK